MPFDPSRPLLSRSGRVLKKTSRLKEAEELDREEDLESRGVVMSLRPPPSSARPRRPPDVLSLQEMFEDVARDVAVLWCAEKAVERSLRTQSYFLRDPRTDRGDASLLTMTPWRGSRSVLGTAPIDVAAHLSLLGEGVTRLGLRVLGEQRALPPSGLYSVLLDMCLCAVGSLMCLTAQVPGLEGLLPQETFVKTLDHIAYFMPGM